MSLPASLVDELQAALGAEHVVTEPEQLRVYECDGLTGHRAIPELVVLPGSTEEVQAVLRACHRERVPFVARGAGTGLSGGATPVAGGVVVSLARMNRILEIDLASQRVVVEPGVANLDVTRAVAAEGFFYAPDPSSQQVCTIGGNVAENSGGAHCLKYGFTTHHVTGLTFVLPDGEVVELGGKALDPDGPDLLGVIVGSEGTLGIATRITLRIVRTPQTVRTLLAGFHTMDAAGAAVSEIIAAGVMPSAIEMMDRLTIEAAERAVAPGYPEGAGAVLLVELDGVVEQVEDDAAELERICSLCARIRDPRSRRATPTARSSGRAASRRSPRWGASRRTTTSRTASFRERDCRRCCDGSRSSRRSTASASGTSSTPATATSTRSSSTTPRRARPSRHASSRRRSSTRASTPAARSPASTASGWTRRARCRGCSPSATSACSSGCAARSIRSGICNPGKVIPTPRLCGEVPGPYRVHALERIGVAERL